MIKTSHPRILNLILYSPSPSYNQMMEYIRKYMKTTGIPYFFYCFDSEIQTSYEVRNDMLLLKGKETYIPGILEKTLLAMEISLSLFPEVEFIVRSNVSTVCNFFRLQQCLQEHTFDYAGSKIFTLNWIDPVNGIKDSTHHGLRYIAGTGIVLSRKACNLLVTERNELNMNLIDDVSIGLFFRMKEICPVSFVDLGYPFPENTSSFNVKSLFYRNRCRNRLFDIKNIKSITEKMVLFPFEFSDYGSQKRRMILSITDIHTLFQFFTKEGISIPPEINLNDLLGDPHPGYRKYLRLKFLCNPTIYVVSEYRTFMCNFPFLVENHISVSA